VEAFLSRFLAATAERPAGTTLAVYETEQLEYRQVDRAQFNARLLRNGPRAAAEFSAAQRLWAQRGLDR
jgi:hypothetical protein